MDFGCWPKRKRLKSSRGVPGDCQMTEVCLKFLCFPIAGDFLYSIIVSSLAFNQKKKADVAHYRNLFVLA